MEINSDINVLGGMPDLNLIRDYLLDNDPSVGVASSIRTRKAINRFESAINATFFESSDSKLLALLAATIKGEGISDDCRLFLFLIASTNNELFDYLNRQVYFPALYSGRTVINPEEVLACLKELKDTEAKLRKWSDYTLKLTASKYLTLLKKFNLVEGSNRKEIRHSFLSDKMFVILIYWMMSIETKTNVLDSKWFVYCFCEKEIFLERIRQSRFSRFFAINFSGDKLKIETLIDYKDVYYVLSHSEPNN